MSKKVALISTVFILGTILIFHLLIFTEQIPYDKVWAGKLNSVEEMKKFEMFSILINIFILMILLVKFRQIKLDKRNKVIDTLIWGFAIFFALNTIGNLFSKNIIELIFGTLLTLVLSVLCILIVKKEKLS
mgnify:FL=1